MRKPVLGFSLAKVDEKANAGNDEISAAERPHDQCEGFEFEDCCVPTNGFARSLFKQV